MTLTNNPTSSPAPQDDSIPETFRGPKFRVTHADPPWPAHQTGALGASRHYDLVSMDQTRSMGEPIRALSEDDAHLWLWVTNATLRDGYDVMEAWGFTPRSRTDFADSPIQNSSWCSRSSCR